jgi:CHAT domain
MQQSHDQIAALLHAAHTTHGNVLTPDDALRLAIAEVEHATMALYWLQIGEPLKQLPLKGSGSRPPMSATKSRRQRENVLEVIQATCRTANEILDDLWEIRPPSTTIERLFARLRIQMLFVQIFALLIVHVYTSREARPKNSLRAMLRQLDAVRLAPDFSERSESERDFVWQASSALYAVLGDAERLAGALQERRCLTAGDPAARALLLVDLLSFAKGDVEKVALLTELEALGASSPLGPLFSRERVGRVSVLRDYLWGTAASVAEDSENAVFAVDAAFACYDTWVYGRTSPPDDRQIQILAAWSGRGRIAWRRDGAPQVRAFSMKPGTVARFLETTALTSIRDRGPIERMTEMLDRELGPLLAEAIASGAEVRLQSGGLASGIPLLMTDVDGAPLGASSLVAFAHPDPNAAPMQPDANPFDLLVIDETFGEQSERVRAAVEQAAQQSATNLRVLAFNSDNQDEKLSDEELKAALESGAKAMVFCHVDTRIAQAPAAGIVTGSASRMQVETVAALDLSKLTEVTIIGCGSGRADLFVGDVTVAHAAAMAGANQVLYTLWPIEAGDGADLAVALVEAHRAGIPTPERLARAFRADRERTAAFALMRP